MNDKKVPEAHEEASPPLTAPLASQTTYLYRRNVVTRVECTNASTMTVSDVLAMGGFGVVVLPKGWPCWELIQSDRR